MKTDEVSEYLICLPRLIVREGFDLSRFRGEETAGTLRADSLQCPFSGWRPCRVDCAMFGCQRRGGDGEHVFICKAPGRPVLLGKPDPGFDFDILLSFSDGCV
ncbi:MAG: hypothetical protein GY854_14960 [Deltaproteobacteria bacterium]|nr:hypothetical protein [Deltaproteobacteria bacterium]